MIPVRPALSRQPLKRVVLEASHSTGPLRGNPAVPLVALAYTGSTVHTAVVKVRLDIHNVRFRTATDRSPKMLPKTSALVPCLNPTLRCVAAPNLSGHLSKPVLLSTPAEPTIPNKSRRPIRIDRLQKVPKYRPNCQKITSVAAKEVCSEAWWYEQPLILTRLRDCGVQSRYKG